MRPLALALLVASCGSSPAPSDDLRALDLPAPDDRGAPDRGAGELAPRDLAPERAGDLAPLDAALPCPAGMALVAGASPAGACVDRFEAPNVAGAQPLVMYTFVEAEAWCAARGKRLCFDDEWTLACAGAAATKYPYGNAHQPGVCNDDRTWKLYEQSKLNGWPASASSPTVATLADLLAAARAKGGAAAVAADHVEWLYQATPSGAKSGCTQPGPAPVYDLCGNVEEWTRRRDGGRAAFHGNLKGRYWAEARTCQSGVISHGDGFRFYEIGFRCCRDP